MTSAEIIEFAAKRPAEVITGHKASLDDLRRIEDTLILAFKRGPQKRVGKVTVPLTLTELTSAGNALAAIMEKRIKMERQAYNLDAPVEDKPAAEGGNVLAILPPEILDMINIRPKKIEPDQHDSNEPTAVQ